MSRTCPQCGSDKIRGGNLHAHDGIRKLLFYAPLRCRACHHRFWALNPLRPALLLIGVAALVGATAWFAVDRNGSLPAAQAPAVVPHMRAEAGDADAQLQLGMRYATGDGLVQNDKEAAKWFERAARQGLAEAQYEYGLALLNGRGVVQDYRAAFGWIEKPALRGHAKAQYSLGELYRYGTGTAIDKARAYLWFNLAAAQGVDTAAKARDSLVWQLKPDQLAAMQEEARRISKAMLAPAPANAPAAPATATP
ncbi:MAG: tetratricopeptide repeat protein [Gammaproteobacteria bacterium]